MTSSLQPGWSINAASFTAGTTSTAADWDALRTAGLKFVLARACVGATADAHWPFHKSQMERLQGSMQKGAWCNLVNDGDEDAQAAAFVALLDADDDPTGWVCAVHLAGGTSTTPGYSSLVRFSKEFWRLAPGQPLLLWTRKAYWNSQWSDKNAKALGCDLISTVRAITDPGIGNCLDGTDLGSINITAFDTSGPKLAFGGGPKHPYSGNYAGFSGDRASTMIQWGTLKVSGTGTEDGLAFNGTMAQLRNLSRPTEPVVNVTLRPSPVFATGYVVTPSVVSQVSVTVTPEPVFARAFVNQSKAGAAVAPGSAIITSEAPSATIEGGH